MTGLRTRPARRALRGGALLAAVLLTPGAAPAAQLDTATFLKLRRGMNEGELLVRAGRPDLVTYPGVTARETTIGGTVTDDEGNTSSARFRRTDIPEVKQYHYIPDRSEHDPYLTVITLRGGLISRLDRTKIFSRENLPEPEPGSGPGSAPPQPVRSDIEIQRDRAERTFQAAREYTDTRSRLLEQSGQPDAGAGQPSTVYRRVEEDGSVYYGDRPSAELPLEDDR